MNVQSMTGYGRAEVVTENYSVAVELKSVNNRFLEFQCRNSKDLLHLEPRLKTELSSFVQRGTVTAHIHYESQGTGEGGLSLNRPLFKAYMQVLEAMRAEASQAAPIALTDLLKLPELVTSSFSQEPADAVAERILPVFRKACEQLVQSREQEGSALGRDLKARIDGFFPALKKVKTLIPERQIEYVAKMRARILELIGDHTLSEDRLISEIGIQAERLDVTEELVRLETHLNHFLETLTNHKAPGKRLGFLLQEMLREVNTLGTKSQYPDIQHICVAWKEELEIIREQIQNLE